MRRLLHIVAALAPLWIALPALADCGDSAGDLSGMAIVESMIDGQCNCCTLRHHGSFAACAHAIVRSEIHAGTLAAACRGNVMDHAKASCPLAHGADWPYPLCTGCNTNADCGLPLLFYCECSSAGTCSSIGGTCQRYGPGIMCVDNFDPVCGCDDRTYSNDCWRRLGGACLLHRGACGAPTTTTTTIPAPTTTLPTGECTTNSDCDDSNGCSLDTCNDGACEHACICEGPSGPTCCPGPSNLCAQCIPLFQTGCTTTDDCCEPCTVLGRAPCAVCINGECSGAP